MTSNLGDGGPAAIVAASGRALESAAQEAYRLYLDHQRNCDQCRISLFTCDARTALWDTFKEAREAAP